MPLVTIDGEDARDFDDAVFAEPDPDRNPAAGACWSRSPTSPPTSGPAAARPRRLGARQHVYFPDRVVPMLPEALSNDWCSLRPGEDRGCLVAELWIDADGTQAAPPLRPRP